jgi:hypothetical protein
VDSKPGPVSSWLLVEHGPAAGLMVRAIAVECVLLAAVPVTVSV